ncbi:MAG TPA: DUF1905 domain-containing protein [Saprospiraceae bacterium]
MKSNGIKYEFTAKPWQHASPGGWCFVSMPIHMAKEIRDLLKSEEEGWGRLKAKAQIGKSDWDTAIWFDSKMKTYLLPLKAEIRKRENINNGQIIQITVWI